MGVQEWLLKELRERNETAREASLAAGLGGGFVALETAPKAEVAAALIHRAYVYHRKVVIDWR